MSSPRVSATWWESRFFETTKGRVVALLRESPRTVDDLARELELTDNAVRSHLSHLERDGLVEPTGVRRSPGAGKPATIYRLVPEVEPLFSRAYLPVLTGLLDALGARLGPEELEGILSAVGQRLAEGQPTPQGPLPSRVRAAAAVLDELGGVTSVETTETGYTIRGAGCALSAAVAECPEVCKTAEALVAALTGAEVHERCDRSGERTRCCFEITART
ncbi:MAG TPA: ArsR family transcriptional regulator [Gemmatimonadaceae bacterium]|nr:ArsR family transcriptional regulator [Gemmatimonadaceae bacterium]